MRISDWSSDVCSSDLELQHPEPALALADDMVRAIRRGHVAQNRRDGADVVEIGAGRILDARVALHQDAERPLRTRRLLRRRSEERRGGKEWVSTCRSRWSPDH